MRPDITAEGNLDQTAFAIHDHTILEGFAVSQYRDTAENLTLFLHLCKRLQPLLRSILCLLYHLTYGYIWSNKRMQIIVDTESSLPLFTQLIEQIKSAVQNEQLQPGAPLPSIRQLANDLEVNKKTVAKAYRLLERDRVIETKGYRGTYVHPDAVSNSLVDLKAWIASRITEAVESCRKAGATDSEIRIAFTDTMNHQNNGSE